MPRTFEREHDDLSDILRGHHSGERLVWPPASFFEREIGCDPARADVGAPDPLLSKLVVERAREPDLSELRRAVDRFVGKAAAAGLGGQRDDVSLPPEI